MMEGKLRLGAFSWRTDMLASSKHEKTKIEKFLERRFIFFFASSSPALSFSFPT